MKAKNQSLFQGTWVVTRKQFLNHKNKWITEKRFPFGAYTWHFNPESEDCLQRGIINESGSISDIFSRKYTYFAEKAEIYIDCSDYSEDGYLFACHEDIYRVEALKNRLILYGLPSVDDAEYVCRLVLKRNNWFNRLTNSMLKTLSK